MPDPSVGLSVPRPGEAIIFDHIAGTVYVAPIVGPWTPPEPPVDADDEHTHRGRSDA